MFFSSLRTQQRLKRSLDVVGAVSGLVVMAPVLGTVALFVRFKLGSPVIFRQTRPGYQGHPFELLKFRTMLPETTELKGPETDGERLTSLGRTLRSWSLDELPTLWNVLIGDMSIVGPRPLLMDYLPLYTAEQMRRHDVSPGITGWAQISGRNAIGWSRKFELDVWYVDNWSFFLDMSILLRTVEKVLRRDGINEAGVATMSRFDGAT